MTSVTPFYPDDIIRPFPTKSIPSIPLPTTTTLPSLTTLPIYPYIPLPMIHTSPKNHLDEILQVDPEEEALRRPKKRRRTKRQRLLELQAQLEQHGDGSIECQQQAEQLLEQLNRPSGRKRRRIASELVDSEKWFCPYECGKFYRKTSTRSIFEHQVECRKKILQTREQEKLKDGENVSLISTTPSTPIIPFIPTFNPTITPLFMQPTFPTFIPTQPLAPPLSQPIAQPLSMLSTSPFTRHPLPITALPRTIPSYLSMPISPLRLMRPIALTSR